MLKIMEQYKNVEYVIISMDEEKPLEYGRIFKGENCEEKLEQIKKQILNQKAKKYNGNLEITFIASNKEEITKSLSIVKTKEYIKKLIKYTKNSTVYAIDKDDWRDTEEAYDYTAEKCLIAKRFEIMVTDPADYPQKDCTLYVHDTLKNKYYVSDKLRFNPQKWNFDFDEDNIKAPEMQYY